MTRKLFLLSFLLLCLCVWGIANPGFALEKTNDDVIAQMQSQGWTIAGDGVLRRELRPHEIEYFVFGAKGFAWKLNDLKMQYRRLELAYRATPTAEIRKAIASHRKEIGSTLRMIDRARAAEEQGLVDMAKDSCTITFGYDAAAGSLTTGQGIWAEGKSNFNANCPGFNGEVYAYAYAQVTVNGGPVTQTLTDGPRSGSNVSAYAYASHTGGAPCYSYAYSSMTSNNLNPSSYSKAAESYSCLPPAPSVSISGTTFIDLSAYSCRTFTWSSNVAGGSAPFSYSWTIDGYQYGTGSSLTTTICGGWGGGFTLAVTVTDSSAQTATASRWVSVYEPSCSDPCICPLVSAKRAPDPICQ